jgi:hypothetical protein
MKRWLVGLSLVLGVLLLTPAPVAHAWSWNGWWSSFSSRNAARKNPPKPNLPKRKPSGRNNSKGHAVPELDPSAAGAAMVLLLGGVAVLVRRGKRKELGSLT